MSKKKKKIVDDKIKNVSADTPEEIADNILDAVTNDLEEASDTVFETDENAIEDAVEDHIEENIEENIENSIEDSIEDNAESIIGDNEDIIEEYTEEYTEEYIEDYPEEIHEEFFEKVHDVQGEADQVHDELQEEIKGQSFGEFSKEFFGHIKDNLVKNKKSVIIVSSFAAIAVIVCVLVYVLTKDNTIVQSSVSDSVSDTYAVSDNTLVVPEDPYEANAYPDVNALITSYFQARQNNDITLLSNIQQKVDAVETAKYEVLSKYIDEYRLKNCYTKKGPFENSYMVYATFDVKMAGYDVLAPGLQTFVVCTREDGSLYIYSGDFDKNIADYISEISSQEDVIELMNRVSVEYNDILASNAEYATYMETFKTLIKTEIGEKIAMLEVAESTPSSDDSLSENDDDAETDANAGGTVDKSFTVKTTTSVNVRKSDSENADKLDTVGTGVVLVCNEEKANGWSEVIYNDQIGYIKTEYLVRADGETANIKTNGILMINETIKIRKEPSTDSDSLGVGYAGQTFEKIETLDNGWTKILFDGKEAYIKSEFIVQ